MSSRYIIKTEM